jgi:hypothetical protein
LDKNVVAIIMRRCDIGPNSIENKQYVAGRVLAEPGMICASAIGFQTFPKGIENG